MKDRAIRRIKIAQIKKRVSSWYDWKRTTRHIGILATTHKSCSCPMCGNRRQFIGETIQEKRHYATLKDWKKSA